MIWFDLLSRKPFSPEERGMVMKATSVSLICSLSAAGCLHMLISNLASASINSLWRYDIFKVFSNRLSNVKLVL